MLNLALFLNNVNCTNIVKMSTNSTNLTNEPAYIHVWKSRN